MREGLADLLRKECAKTVPEAAGAAGVAMPVGITVVVLSEPIRRVAVHVYPRARFATGNQRQAQSQQRTTAARLLVLVLIERRLRSAIQACKRPSRHERTATAAAPVAREVPRLDLVKGPFLRGPAFF